MSVSSDVDKLLSYWNSDGGWGGYIWYSSTNFHTALALQALKAANYSDATVLYQAINFLTTNQNSDGGWGFTSNDPGNAYVTSIVLRTLSQYNSTFQIQPSITKAAAFLLAKQAQNNDGGFGSSPSTVYETALSLMALVESGQGIGQDLILPLQNAINYLTSTQSSNGSWNDDPYSTALALQALAKVKPNLLASSISFSKLMPQEGEEVTISATVNNNGLETASNVIARFYLGDPATGGTQLGTDQFISTLTPNSSTPISITASFTGTGGKTIFVVVDPDGVISETSEADNKSSARIWVATGPDLAVSSEELKPSTFVPTSGAAFTLEYIVRNLGESAADGFDVALYDGDPASGGMLLQTSHISGLNGTEVRTGTFGVTLIGDGSHTLYLVADPGALVPELSVANNSGSVTVTVGGTQTAADLVVTAADITLNPSRPAAGQTVAISAKVRNQGADAAFGFFVELYDGSGTLIKSETISLAAGGEQLVNANWSIPTGIHDLHVIVDRNNGIVESDENNNSASLRVMTDMVDISISATDLVFTPAHPVMGDTVVLTMTARNTGIAQTGPFNVALYDGDPAADGVLLQTFAIANIAGDGSATVTHTVTAEPKLYRFYVVADTENGVAEMYEENNQAIRSLKIKAPGEVLGPDLVPVKIDVSSLATDPQTLAISGTAQVTFQNKGDAKIELPFNLLVFEDKDNDGVYTSGVDNLLGTSTMLTGPTASIPAIWPEGAGMVSVPIAGTVTFLHSPVYALVDSDDAVLEQDETNNILVSCKDCEVVPTNPIQPVLKWKWRSGGFHCYDQVTSQPVIAPLIDSNGDGKIDQQDDPYLVFLTPDNYDRSCGGGGLGAIHAVNGKTGQELFTIQSQGLTELSDVGFTAGAHLAIGDINNDGKPEILVAKWSNYYWTGLGSATGLLAFKNDGSLLWDNSVQIANWNLGHLQPLASRYQVTVSWTAPISIADIDADGSPDIVAGVAAFNYDGSVKWGYPVFYYWIGQGSPGRGQGLVEDFSVTVADIDLDGKQETLAGKTVYNADGTVQWWNKDLTDGFSMAVNLNEDPYPEILFGTKTYDGVSMPGIRIYLFDHTGEIIWGPVYVKNLEPTAPNTGMQSSFVIADFDGDGETEIGIKGYDNFFLLDRNGTLENTIPMPWFSSIDTSKKNMSSPTVFDLNGDGRPELISNTGITFKIQDVKDGTVLYQEPFGGSNTNFYSNVIVSDVDNDGHAELVVFGGSGGTSGYITPQEGLNVYRATNNDWAGSRTISNELFYHVTNVNDDGSIPQHEAPSWLLNNSYFTQAAVGPNPNPYLTPNLTASLLHASQDSTGTSIVVRVGNGGAKEALAGVPVTFYDGLPATGTVLGTALTTRVLQPGEYQDLILGVSSLSDGLHHITTVVDEAMAISECNETDNQAELDLTIATGLPDLKIGTEDITVPALPITEGSIVPITAVVRDQGSVSASNVTVRLYNGNPSTGGQRIGADQVISSINAGDSMSLTFFFDTLGHAGQNIVYVSLDPDNAIVEATRGNNVVPVSINVQPPQLPNFVIDTNSIQVVPADPREGEQVTITATITNRGTAAGNVPVKIVVRGQGSGVSEDNYSDTKTIYPIIGLGQTAAVTTTFDTAGLAGQQSIVVTVDPANSITESDETDNSAAKPIFIQSAGFASSVLLDKAAYQANENMTATINASNSTADGRSLFLTMAVWDNVGNLIATISSGDAVALGPNGAVTLTRTWNTGKSLAEDYSVTTELAEGGIVISRAHAGFTITPDKNVESKVTTDKLSYDPNETASITSTITSQSANYIQENLSATMTIAGVGGQGSGGGIVHTETKTIAILMPGASFTFKSYWNAGISTPGTYPVTLEIKDAAGAIIASSAATVNLLSSSQTGAGITGAITANQNPVYQGREETFAYSITNTGNEDIADLTTTIIIADPETGEMKTEAGGPQTGVVRGETVANTQSISTFNLAPRTYLAVLQVQTVSMTTPKTLASALFEVKPGIEIAKSIPDLVNLLVWVNDGCEGQSAGAALVQKCVGIDVIGQALTEAGAAYRIVTAKKDFQAEFRNPIYTDYMVLGDQNPVEDHISEELREQVFAGKGLISSLFNSQSLGNEVFGIASAGGLPGRDYTVELAESGFGIQGTFPSYGKALKIEAAVPAEVIGTMTDNSGKAPVQYPAIIGRGYGKGKTLFFAFDLGMSSSNQTVFLGLLKQSLDFIHAPLDPADLIPNQLVPVEITIKSLGAAFDIQITETYPEGTKIYDPATRTWVADNPWARTIELASHQTATILYYAKTPDAAGTYIFQTGAGYLEDGNYVPYQTVESELTVTKSAGEALIEAVSGLQALRLKGVEAAARENAVRYLNNVMNMVVLTQSDREAMIADLRQSVSSVVKITNVDISRTRYLLDSLLLFWEAEWYLSEP